MCYDRSFFHEVWFAIHVLSVVPGRPWSKIVTPNIKHTASIFVVFISMPCGSFLLKVKAKSYHTILFDHEPVYLLTEEKARHGSWQQRILEDPEYFTHLYTESQRHKTSGGPQLAGLKQEHIKHSGDTVYASSIHNIIIWKAYTIK